MKRKSFFLAYRKQRLPLADLLLQESSAISSEAVDKLVKNNKKLRH